MSDIYYIKVIGRNISPINGDSLQRNNKFFFRDSLLYYTGKLVLRFYVPKTSSLCNFEIKSAIALV